MHKGARTDPCGGRGVTRVPTATQCIGGGQCLGTRLSRVNSTGNNIKDRMSVGGGALRSRSEVLQEPRIVAHGGGPTVECHPAAVQHIGIVGHA